MLIDDSELDKIEATYAALRKGGRLPATGWVRGATRLLEYNPYHDPNDGRFTDEGHAKAGGITVTSSVKLAARILGEGGKIRLRSKRQVSTLLNRLAAIAEDAARRGVEAPNYDLCKVSVKNTNLFCAQSKGVARINMPQLGGQAVPGTRAARLKPNAKGEVDASRAFVRHLEHMGVTVRHETELASFLKASQSELVGAKVGGMLRAARAGKYDPTKGAIFVSRDNYVIDGHHRWAAVVGLDANNGRLGELRMQVTRIDMDIIEALAEANSFTHKFGIAPKAARVKEAAERAVRAVFMALREYNQNHDDLGRFAKSGTGKRAALPHGKLDVDTWSRRADAHEVGTHGSEGLSTNDRLALVGDLDAEINRWEIPQGTPMSDPRYRSPQWLNSPEIAREALREFVYARASRVLLFTARSGGKLTGIAAVRRDATGLELPYEEGSSKKLGGWALDLGRGQWRSDVPTMEVDFLGASPHPEDKGSGRRILAEVARMAAREGRFVTLHALPSAASFYRSIGMTQSTTRRSGALIFYFTPGQANRFASVVLDAHKRRATGPSGETLGYYAQGSLGDYRRGRIPKPPPIQQRLFEALQGTGLPAVDDDAPPGVREYVLAEENAPGGLQEGFQGILALREVWHEELHPRAPAGTPDGGQFAASGGARSGSLPGFPKGLHHRQPTAEEMAGDAPLDPKVKGSLGRVVDGKWEPARTKSGRVTKDAQAVMDILPFEVAVNRADTLFDEALAASKTGEAHWSPALFEGRKDFYWKRNAEVHEWAREFGVKPEAVAGVMAELSNQNYWEDNVKAARAVFVAIAADEKIVFDEGYRRAILRATSVKDSKPIDIKKLGLLGRTVRLSEMDARTAAMVHPDIPHGSYGYTHMEKAIRIARGQAGPEDIGGPKLRSFYTNIIRPDLDTHVTIDTHMIRLLLDDPHQLARDKMPDGDPRQGRLESFGRPGGANDYMRQAIFEAARRRGVKPHELQAIAWWRWRDKHGKGSDSADIRRGKKVEKARYAASWSGMEVYRSLRIRHPEHTIEEEDRDAWFNQAKYAYETGRTARPRARRVKEAAAARPGRRAAGSGGSPGGLGGLAARILRTLERHGGGPADPPGTTRLLEYNHTHDERGRFARRGEGRIVGSMSPRRLIHASMAEIAEHVNAAWAGKAGTDLAGLPTNVSVGEGARMEVHSLAVAQEAARGYMKEAGLPYDPPTEYVKVDKERAARIAKAYDRMKHAPQDPKVAAAYDAMARETIAQFDYIVKHTGLQVEFMPEDGDAYGSSPQKARADVVLNNHIYIFPTAEGFGSSDAFDASDNPLLADSGRTFAGKQATVNDIFRAVHDYFGHMKEGNGFRADGEENAWRVHSAMYSPLARRAMTSETRGQNSWVNFGPHAEFNRTASGVDTIYADQKAGIMPLWVVNEGSGRTRRRTRVREAMVEDEMRPGCRINRIRDDAEGGRG